MTSPNRYPRWSVAFRMCLALSVSSATAVFSSQSAAAIEVDTELILLVDVSGSVTSEQFTSLMNSYAAAITSSSVLDAIQSGDYGKIAATLVFWGGETSQVVAVPWMEISNATQAASFSTLLLAATRPFEGRTAIGSALNYATPLFGTETGGQDNGFSSLVQIIDISGDGFDNASPPRGDREENVRAARDASLATGVDMINGLPIGNTDGSLAAYYARNVIGGSVGDVSAFVQDADTYANVEGSLVTKLTREIGAATGNKVVPEPSTAFLSLITSVFLLRHRSRK